MDTRTFTVERALKNLGLRTYVRDPEWLLANVAEPRRRKATNGSGYNTFRAVARIGNDVSLADFVRDP